MKNEHGVKSHWTKKHPNKECPLKKDNTATSKCEYCDDTYAVPKAQLDETRFCSRTCASKYYYERGHEVQRISASHNQNTVKQYVRDRDNRKCRRCGVAESELSNRIPVHHLISEAQFHVPAIADAPSNLVSLCPSCHPKVEMMPLEKSKQEVSMEDAPSPIESLIEFNPNVIEDLVENLLSAKAIREEYLTGDIAHF